MKPLTDTDYKEILEQCFSEGKTVVCGVVTSPNCSNCAVTRQNVMKLFEKYPMDNLDFYFVEYSKYDILQNYHQFNSFLEFPKTVVFYGNWEDRDYFEGVITSEQLEGIYKKSTTVNSA